MAQDDRPLVLIIEDEPAQMELIRYNMDKSGFQTCSADDGEQALLLAKEEEPDLILLDWMLPLVSGIEVCRRLKANKATRTTPILMLTARGEEDDRVRGLDTGADDYLVKPYSTKELIARARALLRRTRGASVGQILSYGNLQLDGEKHKVTRDGIPIKLGPIEFRLLATLMERPGKVHSREQLLDRVWGRDQYVDSRTVDVHVGRLRKSLQLPGSPSLIRTVRGAGYSLDSEN